MFLAAAARVTLRHSTCICRQGKVLLHNDDALKTEGKKVDFKCEWVFDSSLHFEDSF